MGREHIQPPDLKPPPYLAAPTAAEHVVRRAVASAVNNADTWVIHPSFDTKTAVLGRFRDAFTAARALTAAANGTDLVGTAHPTGSEYGVNWDAVYAFHAALTTYKPGHDTPPSTPSDWRVR